MKYNSPEAIKQKTRTSREKTKKSAGYSQNDGNMKPFSITKSLGVSKFSSTYYKESNCMLIICWE